MELSTTTSSMPTTTDHDHDLPRDKNIQAFGSNTILLASGAIVLSVILVSCVVRMSMLFCVRHRQDHTCHSTCLEYLTCRWIWEECSQVRYSRNLERGNPADSPCTTYQSPPPYPEALGLPRPDSTTIPGLPPPTYSSLHIQLTAQANPPGPAQVHQPSVTPKQPKPMTLHRGHGSEVTFSPSRTSSGMDLSLTLVTGYANSMSTPALRVAVGEGDSPTSVTSVLPGMSSHTSVHLDTNTDTNITFYLGEAEALPTFQEATDKMATNKL